MLGAGVLSAAVGEGAGLQQEGGETGLLHCTHGGMHMQVAGGGGELGHLNLFDCSSFSMSHCKLLSLFPEIPLSQIFELVHKHLESVGNVKGQVRLSVLRCFSYSVHGSVDNVFYLPGRQRSLLWTGIRSTSPYSVWQTH